MISPFSFQGRIGRLPYALWSFGILFSQHLFVWSVYRMNRMPLDIDGWFMIVPLRLLGWQPQLSWIVPIAGLACLLLVAWALAALAFRRAVDADVDEWLAAAAMVPLLQIPVIAFLCVMPTDVWRKSAPEPAATGAPPSAWPPAVQGMVAGTGLTLVAVACSTLVFRVY